MDQRPLPDRIRPLEGAGLVNIASEIRAPLDDAPIDPMRHDRDRLPFAIMGTLLVVGALFLVLAW